MMDQAAKLRTIVEREANKVYYLRRDERESKIADSKGPIVITIASGKGGVGKTNIVVNLAIACSRLGKKVLVLDADLGLANIDIIFGLNPKHNIEEIISGEKELSEIIIDGPEGIGIIPASSGVQSLTQLTEGQKIHLLNEFDTMEKDYDILLIDTGSGVSSNVTYFNIAAEERLIVVTPEPTSITDAYALMKIMCREYGIKNFHLLMNMVTDEYQAKSVYDKLTTVMEKFIREISIEYAGFIPRDNLLQKSVSNRVPVLCANPDAASSHSFMELAKFVIAMKKKRYTRWKNKIFLETAYVRRTG